LIRRCRQRGANKPDKPGAKRPNTLTPADDAKTLALIEADLGAMFKRIARQAASVKMGAVNTPRAVGALNRAMGERPAQPPERSGEKSSVKDVRRIGDPSPGEPMRRPI